MKKKLTKEQKEKRQHFLKVTKNVVFYISLALNVLILLAFAITGCSPKSNVQSYNRIDLGEATQLRKEKANENFNANDLDCVGYDLTLEGFNYKGGVTYNGEFTTTLANAYTLGTPSSSTLALINTMVFNLNVNGEPVTGNHISYSVNGNSNVRTYTYNGSTWTVTGSNVVENIYINKNLSVTNETYVFYHILEQFFNVITPYNYRDLNSNWSPLSYFNKVDNFFVNDAVGQYTIIKDGLMSANGIYYNQLIAYVDTGTIYRAVDNNGSISYMKNENVKYIGFVMLKNTYTSAEVIILLPSMIPFDNNGSVSYAVTGYYETRDYNLLKIYQFHFNDEVQGTSPLTSLKGYSNYNALNVSSSYSINDSSNGDFGDVFGLIGTAFNGLTSLLAIKVLPGITLGILFFVPVIAFIVFAIVRVIKK